MAKRNRELLLQSGTNEKQRWAIRKLSIGVVSVFIGMSLFFLMDSNTRVNADSISNELSGQTIIQDSTSNSSDQPVSEQKSASPTTGNQEAKAESTNHSNNQETASNKSASNNNSSENSEDNYVAVETKQLVQTSHRAGGDGQISTDSISENKTKLAKANADTTAVPGFSVTDPEYPSEMYRDPNPEHYSFLWVGQTGNGYQTVISTNRNGDGQIHVFELDQSNTVLNSFNLDKNQSRTSRQTGVTYFNDEYAGLVSAGSPRRWTLKYEISGGKSDHSYNAISFIVPRLNTQVTSYHDEDGNDIIDNNSEKIESVVQRGLDGQKYTTIGTKLIDGYYAKAPSNAQGTMSPYGKIGSKYEKNWHDGYIAEFTQINNAGDMSVQMYREDQQGNRTPVNRPMIIKPGDIDIYSGVNNIYLRSIYVPQTIDIRYVYKKLGNTVPVDEDNNPFKGNTPTQYPNDPNDPTKAGKVVIPQYEGYTPKINGVPVGPDGFIPTDPGEDTMVIYTANSATALVRFIDNTKNRTLADLESKGKTGETIDFDKANAQLKSYLDRGYKPVANEIPTTKTKFDTSDDTDGPSQVFVVRLDHGTVTVTPDNPVEPGDKINPNDPGSPTYTPDQARVTEDHSLTVHYVGAPNNPADSLQHSRWTREVTIDKVTGKTISSTDWVTADSYVAVKTPEIAGYTPDKSVVDEPTVRTDQEVTVIYTANSATALVRFIDNTKNRTLADLESKGKTGETIDFDKANAQLKSYLDRGYKLVANEIPTTKTKFDTSDDTDGPSQVFVVRLDHGTVTVTPDNPVEPGDKINPNDPGSPTYTPDQARVTEDHSLTVHYVGAPNNPADSLQHSRWTREVTIDKVTGKTISSTDWVTADSYIAVKTPEIAGYTPDKSVVDEPTVRTDRVITVTYVKKDQELPVPPEDNKPSQNNQEQPKPNETTNNQPKQGNKLPDQIVNSKTTDTKTLPQTGVGPDNNQALLGSLLLSLAVFLGLPYKKKQQTK
ncbi:YSIRK-type signal peptide-containing protein (plasmid) [Ligilactobacillus salivarius]|uniref:mucin-binding protein n=1 Tax=Ligilactobacillus salivarius TaxID=1624 RepID=UPI003C2B1591